MTEYLDFFSVYIMGSTEMLFQFYFFARILKKKVCLPLYFLFTVCAVTIIHFVPAGTIIGFGMLVFLLTAGGMLACHADFKSSLLYAALVVEIMLLSYGVIKELSSMLYLLIHASCFRMSGVVFMLGSETASLLLTGVCYYIVYRYFSGDALSPFRTTAEMQYMFLIFIPILMIFIMSEYMNALEYSVEIVESEGPAGYLFHHWQMLAMYFLGIASLFCILLTYKKLLQNFRLSTELSLLEQEEHSLNQYVEEAKSRYEKTKSFRHDIKNHIAVVKELLQKGKTKAALDYIRDMEDIAEELSFPCSTNNPVVDILVGNKLGIAKNLGADVRCSLLLPYPCGLRDIDICIILSNALDNAIHACKSMDAGAEKYIQVSGRIQGDFLMLEIENSFREKGTFRKGTGLSNVKLAAEKYGGAMNIETRGGVFVLQVLLIIPQHPESSPQQMD